MCFSFTKVSCSFFAELNWDLKSQTLRLVQFFIPVTWYKIKMWISVNSVVNTTPLYNMQKHRHSPLTNILMACYHAELKTNGGETRDRGRQTSWLPCRWVWRLWECCSAANQSITQTTSSLLTLQLPPTMEGWWDLMLQEMQTTIQSDMHAALKHIITSITSYNYNRNTNMCEKCRRETETTHSDR